MKWRDRMEFEFMAHAQRQQRSWFLTYTLKPERRELLRSEAEKREIDQQRLLLNWTSEHIKRLRSQAAWAVTGARIKWLGVIEPHKSGDWHVHLLVHGDCNSSLFRGPGRWPHGWQVVLEAKPDVCAYLAKYLMKNSSTLIRASNFYGAGLHHKDSRKETDNSSPPKGEEASESDHNKQTTTLPPSEVKSIDAILCSNGRWDVVEEVRVAHLLTISEWLDPQGVAVDSWRADHDPDKWGLRSGASDSPGAATSGGTPDRAGDT